MARDEDDDDKIEYRDINSMYWSGPKKKEEKPKQKAEPEPEPEKKKDPEFEITNLEVIVPDQGILQNKPLEFKGTVKKLAQKILCTRLSVDFVTDYKGKEDIVATNIAGSIKDDLTFTGRAEKLFFNDPYLRDNNKSADAKFSLVLRAKNSAAAKEFKSAKIDLPMETKAVFPLKNGMYDKEAVNRYPDKYTENGQNSVIF